MIDLHVIKTIPCNLLNKTDNLSALPLGISHIASVNLSQCITQLILLKYISMVYLACCPVTAGTGSNHNPELDKWKEIDLWTKIMSTLDICNFK